MQNSTGQPHLCNSLRVPGMRRRLTGAAVVIYKRMRELDHGQGCSASVKVLAHAEGGFSITPKHCSRVVSKLRRQRLIHLEGQTLNQCNLYTFPDRKYDRAQLEQLLVLPASGGQK